MMPTTGKAPDSFVVLDLMRPPWEFFRESVSSAQARSSDNLIQGVTTAATLWFVTVLGPCFGGGQIGLSVAGSLLGLAVIAGLKLIERHIKAYRKVQFAIKWRRDAFSHGDVLRMIVSAELQIVHVSVKHGEDENELRCDFREHALPDRPEMPTVLAELARRPGVLELEWKT
jgi:putative Mg2+ transporter-C (MgtC) family protein